MNTLDELMALADEYAKAYEEDIRDAHGPFDGAKHERAALASALSELVADAGRYRWLRAGRLHRQGHATEAGNREILKSSTKSLMVFSFWCGDEELDAAIDAARQQEAK